MKPIDTPTGWDDKLKSRLEGLTPEEKARLLEMLKENEENNENEQENIEPNPELFWNKEAILKDLKENYVNVEENAEMMWQKWKKVHIELPAVWNFKWFKFDYFVSYKDFYPNEFKSEQKFVDQSYSMKDIWELLNAMNKYMKELWINIDTNMDYENDLQYWETQKFGCEAWDCIKEIAWLNYLYWLKDRTWLNGIAAFHCNMKNCFFYDEKADNGASRHLLLKLFD